MILDQLIGLPLGVYRVHWKYSGSHVAAIGQDKLGNYWIAPAAAAIDVFFANWDQVDSLQLIEVQDLEDMAAARRAVEIVNAYGKFESCCECGDDYPRADLIRGNVYCPKCRAAEAQRKPK